MKIIDLDAGNEEATQQAANLLLRGFRAQGPDAWSDLDPILEIQEVLEKENICRIAVDEKGEIIGLVGGFPRYYGSTWELHPIVVDPDHQGKGIGQALVADFEQQVKSRGGITIYLGTDDECDQTSLSNTDLYPDVFEYIRNIKNLRQHPYEFYQKQGYTIVGVIPDANGLGKPDILMAKRVR